MSPVSARGGGSAVCGGLSIAAAVGLLACGPADANRTTPPGVYSEIDSAGVAVSTNPPELLRATLDGVVSNRPLQLPRDGVDSVSLYQVQGIRALPGGNVLVVDAGNHRVRVFDCHGELELSIGRRGKGPGEFISPVLLPWPRTDSILLFDRGLLRFQTVSLEGHTLHASAPVERWWGNKPPEGAVKNRVLLEKRRPIGGEPIYFQDGLRSLRAVTGWFDLGTFQDIPLDTTVIDLYYEEGSLDFDIPFTARPSAAVMDSGVWITDGRRHELRKYDPFGRLDRIIRVAAPVRPVSSTLLEQHEHMIVYSGANTGLRPGMDLLRSLAPDSLPAYRSLLVDDAGLLWVELYEPFAAANKRWLVFQPEGRLLGVVKTPQLDIQHIGQDHLVGVWKDDLGAEYVRRYEIDRSRLQSQHEGHEDSCQGLDESLN